MRVKIAIRVFVAVLLASATLAKEGVAAERKSVATPVPGPPHELDQLKYWVGKWKCEGQVFATPLGPAFPVINNHSFEPALDGFWYVRREEDAKTAENPNPNRDIEFEGYDTATRRFVAVGYDNAGGTWSNTSAHAWGPFLGTYRLNSKSFEIRYTPTRMSDREWSAVSEAQFDGNWRKTGSFTCRRQ